MRKQIYILVFSLALLCSCMRMPDLAQAWEIAEKVEQTLKCQQIAAQCIEVVAKIDRTAITVDDVETVQRCATRWDKAHCSQAVEELTSAAEALCSVD